MSKLKQHSAKDEDSKAVIMASNMEPIRPPHYKILEPRINEMLVKLELLYCTGVKTKKYLKARQSTLGGIESLIEIDFSLRQLVDDTFNLEAEEELIERNINSIYQWVSDMEVHPINVKDRNANKKGKK